MKVTSICSTIHRRSDLIWGCTLKDLWPDGAPRVCAVVDSNALWYYNRLVKELGASFPMYVIKSPDESKKTQKTVAAIHAMLFAANAGRKTFLLAVGGGATLDTSGFAASIFKRGISWIAVPTTLLSYVDASVGGKTAINTLEAKNAIGSFYPPRYVLLNNEPAKTWNEKLRLEGVAEIYKIFTTFSPRRRASLVNGVNEHHARQAVMYKVKVVRLDPWEENLRAVLNVGHSFGHAVEHATGIAHGLAVAVGFRLENFAAVKKGIMTHHTAEIMESELDALGFEHRIKLPSWDELLKYLVQDKKNVVGELSMSLLNGEVAVPFKKFDPLTRVTIQEAKWAYDQYKKE